MTKPIPWRSTGRMTAALRVTKSLLPVGILPFTPDDPGPVMRGITTDHPDLEKYLMRIMGTAIQVGPGKLLTTAETLAASHPTKKQPFVLAHVERESARIAIPYPIPQAVSFFDLRTKQANPTVDAALLIVPAKSTNTIPYDIKPLSWGDSTDLGVGDPIMVAGYPLGTDLFLECRSNRGFIQPTVYSGTIGAIIPAISPTDTRLLRLTVPGIGGISGGAVFSVKEARLLGMVTTSMHAATLPQPVLYALPSEVLRPYVESVSFEAT